MRIIAGKHKNRIIDTVKTNSYRPTTAKFREALFSIISSEQFTNLQPLKNAKMLDLFAGTGAFSFEGLSRGAGHSTLIDNNHKCLKLIEKFADKIGEKENINCKLADASKLGKSTKQYDIVFMDPPYNNDLCKKTLTSLINNSWLNNNAIIIMEMEKMTKFPLEKFSILNLLKERIYGNSKLLITQYKTLA